MLVIFALLFMGALAPFEALGWWAGWFDTILDEIDLEDSESIPDNTLSKKITAKKRTVKDVRADAVKLPSELSSPAGSEKARTFSAISQDGQQHFVVFLSGIHSVSGRVYAKREIVFLERLRARAPHIKLVAMFPYSVTNRALTGQRTFAWLWRLVLKNKTSKYNFTGFLINLRNMWQVAVSADGRYGPIYNEGSAEMVLRSLKKHGFKRNSAAIVTLVGYSGGGQIAVGAVPYLKRVLEQPIHVISLGGVISSDPGLLSVSKLYHMAGRRDMVQRIGNVMCPGRWPFVPLSSWNQAKQEGLIDIIDMGKMDHTGVGGYLDDESYCDFYDARHSNQSYLEVTLDAFENVFEDIEHLTHGVPSPS